MLNTDWRNKQQEMPSRSIEKWYLFSINEVRFINHVLLNDNQGRIKFDII